jgi:hypothetical protein
MNKTPPERCHPSRPPERGLNRRKSASPKASPPGVLRRFCIFLCGEDENFNVYTRMIVIFEFCHSSKGENKFKILSSQ